MKELTNLDIYNILDDPVKTYPIYDAIYSIIYDKELDYLMVLTHIMNCLYPETPAVQKIIELEKCYIRMLIHRNKEISIRPRELLHLIINHLKCRAMEMEIESNK